MTIKRSFAEANQIIIHTEGEFWDSTTDVAGSAAFRGIVRLYPARLREQESSLSSSRIGPAAGRGAGIEAGETWQMAGQTPARHLCVGHPIALGDLGHRLPAQYLENRLVSLLHESQLHQHDAHPLRRRPCGFRYRRLRNRRQDRKNVRQVPESLSPRYWDLAKQATAALVAAVIEKKVLVPRIRCPSEAVTRSDGPCRINPVQGSPDP